MPSVDGQSDKEYQNGEGQNNDIFIKRLQRACEILEEVWKGKALVHQVCTTYLTMYAHWLSCQKNGDYPRQR